MGILFARLQSKKPSKIIIFDHLKSFDFLGSDSHVPPGFYWDKQIG